MNYHPDDFLNLIEAAEEQGGAHLSGEVCKPNSYRLNLPIDPERPRGPKRSERLTTTGCRRHAKFLVALLPDSHFVETLSTEALRELIDIADFDDNSHSQALLADGAPALAKACAVDDAMGLWPRFEGAMHTGESFQEF
jgi:hypothetical protein